MLFSNKVLDVYKSRVFTRSDDLKDVFYFSHEDFEGLKKETFNFKSKMGHDLKGAFYHYDDYDTDTLVIFDHGMGGGHRSYMREIEKLVSFGYRVYAYDHTGCMESGGKDSNGFAQSLSDLDDCLKALNEIETYKDLKKIVMGHSWGGYSTMNIVAFHSIHKIVAISGFISVEAIIAQNFNGLLKLYRKDIYKLEEKANPLYVKCNALESLKDFEGKALLFYSDNDALVQKEMHYDPLENAFKESEHIKLVLMHEKEHNPNYTKDAIAYKNQFFEELTKHRKTNDLKTLADKEAFVNSFNWKRMTCQDEDFWNQVKEFLKD